MVLLCTLLPFGKPLVDGLTEVSLTYVAGGLNRSPFLRFTSERNVTVSMSPLGLAHTEWLELCTRRFEHAVTLKGLMTHINGPEGPVIVEPIGVRVYVNKTFVTAARLCEPQVVSLESILGIVIRNTPLTVEFDAAKKRRPAWDLCNKTLSVKTTVPLTEGVFWSFNEQVFQTYDEPAREIEVRPTVLVSGAGNGYQHSLVHQTHTILTGLTPRRRAVASTGDDRVVLPSTVLVVTAAIEPWTQAAKSLGFEVARVGPRGLCPNGAPQVVLATIDDLAASAVLAADLEDAISAAANVVLECPSLRQPQKRRLIFQLARKFSNFVLPLGYVQTGAVIVDDVEALGAGLSLLDAAQALRRIDVFKDHSTTKPVALSEAQVACLNWRDRHTMRIFAAHVQPLVQIIPVSKAVLRKIKVFGHQVRNGPIEDRLVRTFANKYCPITTPDAVQRFSGRPVPLAVAADLIGRHFQRLSVTLGMFLQPPGDAAALSQAFVTGVLQQDAAREARSCCICFEDLPPTAFNVSLCGHVYCKDCSRHQFHEAWAACAAKDCAQCRTPLLQGDFFQVEEFSKESPWVPTQASKAQAVSSFLGGLRTLHDTKIWDPTAPPKEPVRHLIITDVSAAKPVDLVQALQDNPSTASVHVFYAPGETAAFHKFETAF